MNRRELENMGMVIIDHQKHKKGRAYKVISTYTKELLSAKNQHQKTDVFA
jgi:hypothetical protein